MIALSEAVPTVKLKRIRVRGKGDAARAIAVDDRIAELLAADAPVAFGVSGGKDSVALALAGNAYLDSIGHKGPRVLVHADLGKIEWKDSLPTCQRLAAHLGIDLLVVAREKGGMIERWYQRWEANVRRYAEMLCVKIILPWSTPSMRFCTSELKTKVICGALARRFPGREIVSAAGIRRSESADRSDAPISEVEPELERVRLATSGVIWNPLVEWQEEDVYAIAAARGFAMHEGYTVYGMSRISCTFCIMQNEADQIASASVPENQDNLRVLVALEILSTFGFQGGRWLADIAPHLLDERTLALVADAKARAELREAIEAEIPKHLLYTKGWPTCIPTLAEAEMLCRVRRHIAELLRIEVKYTEPAALIARYTELFTLARAREAEKTAKAARKAAKAAKAAA